MLCVDCASGDRPATIRRNSAAGCLVDPAARGVPRIVGLSRVLDLGRLSRRALHVRAVSLALLFPGNIRRFAAQSVWAEAGGVAGVASFLARAAHPAHPRSIPPDLLLLPRGVLQSLLERSAFVN